ncbi:hypothetical protein [Mariniplasma anaerobium]|uniref:Uncharacterized protein n=1 Tax=Mariniplasma anaerobium TaxID=2735436 RepID=A0A7U9TJD0_9MOLU|nr:hypothetical protein [Mariniplasma anaerobium]BCR36539.1 hypothetical protein MPAN_014320 [Mariniplasma anaerobium]
MKQRKLVIGLLVMLAVAVSGFTFAFWAGSVTGNNDTASGTVTIGAGDTVATTVTVGDETSAGALVPFGLSGVSAGSPVEYVLLTFDVAWDSTDDLGDGTVGALSVAIGDREVNSVEFNSLFLVSYQIGGAAPTVTTGASSYSLTGTADTAISADAGSTVPVYVLVQMTEPTTEGIYDDVTGQDVVFTVTFTVTP